MSAIIPEKDIHRVFELSLLFKGAFALLEVIGGLITLFVSGDYILKFLTQLTQEDITTDPEDVFAQHLLSFAQHFFLNSQHFVALYLITHGGVKLFLVGGLMRNKLWCYPLALVVFTGFICYQLYRYTLTHSPWLLFLTVFDLLVIWLVWHEYHALKGRKAEGM